MKKLIPALCFFFIFPVCADTVTGNVDAVSFCEYSSNNVVNLIQVDGNWYRGEESGTGADSVRLTMHEWWLSAPLAAIMGDKTITITYAPVTETRCGKTVVGRYDYSSSYGEIQVNN